MSRMEKFGIKFGIRGSRLKKIINILDIFYKEEYFSITDFAVIAGVTPRAIEKNIEFLRKQIIIKFQVAHKTGKYMLTEKGKSIIKEMIGWE